MTIPVRLHFPRGVKGFSLDAHSRAINGLPAKRVTRPSRLGNPFRVGGYFMLGDPDGRKAGIFAMTWCEAHPDYATAQFTQIKTKAEAVDWYRRLVAVRPPAGLGLIVNHNLACACRLCPRHAATGLPMGETCADCGPCHADTLLERASRP